MNASEPNERDTDCKSVGRNERMHAYCLKRCTYLSGGVREMQTRLSPRLVALRASDVS